MWFPVVVLVQLIFTVGARALSLAALTVHFRDIRDILANVLMFWFFCDADHLPLVRTRTSAGIKPLFDLNPFTHLAVSYQEILFFPGPVGHWRVAARARRRVDRLFLAGYWFFDRLRDSFAEVV